MCSILSGSIRFSLDVIKRVVGELYYVFDFNTIDEADRYFCESPYLIPPCCFGPTWPEARHHDEILLKWHNMLAM